MSARAQGRQRRQRSATESLLAIALGLEALLVFFVMLTVFGLRYLEPVWAFGGGIAFMIAFAVTASLVRHTWAQWLGWALQVALFATGFLIPAMFVVAAVFTAIWVYCVIMGRRLDARSRAVREAADGTDETDRPDQER